MKAVLMALVMTIRLSSGRVRLLLCASAYHTSRNGATDPSRANKFKLREFPKRGNSFPCRPRDTPIWKLEGSFRCRSCRTRRYKPPVHMIKLAEAREITPYACVHPYDDR